MAEEGHRNNKDEIVPGMEVVASEGDLGEHDVSSARVISVQRGQRGHVEAIEVEKGALFRKTLYVLADRIQEVRPPTSGEDIGKVILNVKEEELEALRARRSEERLPTQDERSQQEESHEQKSHATLARSMLLLVIGPGFLSGTSGNDPSAVTAYAIDGASAGYAHLWLMLLTTPLYYAVQFACAKIGRISQKGLSQLLREHYGPRLAIAASLLLAISNIALIASDLAAIGSGFELITGFSWLWFVVPIAVILWYLTVYRGFEAFKKIFLVMSSIFVAYILASFLTHANWGDVLRSTFVPHIGFDFTSISSAVALLGATISPYSMFWQAKAEVEEQRAGTLRQQLHEAKLDVGSGAVAGQLVAYFIIICTASTLFVHHQSINTAEDAARSLQPLAGPLARYLFAIGLIGSGLVAIPVLLASTSYAVAGAVGWPEALAKRPWQSEGFYLILTAALAVSLILTLLGINPIQLIFWSNIITAIIAPPLIITILLVGNHRTIMQGQRLHLLHNFCLALTGLILIAGSIMLFYQLATGRGS